MLLNYIRVGIAALDFQLPEQNAQKFSAWFRDPDCGRLDLPEGLLPSYRCSVGATQCFHQVMLLDGSENLIWSCACVVPEEL